MLDRQIQILERTKEILREKTWVPRTPKPNSDECCLVTAVYTAVVDLANRAGPREAFTGLTLLEHLEEHTGRPVIVWNDAQTSVEAVIEAIDKTLKGLSV